MNVTGIILSVVGLFIFIFANSRSPDKMWTFAFSWVLKPEAYYFLIVVSLGLIGVGAYLIIDEILDKKKEKKEAVSKINLKKCPKCAETIKFEAKVCKHCSYEFSEEEILRQKEEREKLLQYDEYASDKIDDYQLLQIAYDYQYNQRDYVKANYYLERLRKEYPQSEYLPYAEQRLREMGAGEGRRAPSQDFGIGIAEQVSKEWMRKIQGWELSNIKIAAPAYPYLLGSGVLVVLGFIFSWWLVILGLGAGAFLAYCFRDPERNIPSDPLVVVSPADGKVLFIDTVWEDRFLKASARRVAISLSLLDVHVNRSPIAGMVVKTEHQPGRFAAPVTREADKTNERRIWMLVDEDERRFMVVQVAGQLTRRIIPFAEGGQKLCRGERLGMICFGSRVDLFLPPEAQVTVTPGSQVLAGTDMVARLPRPR